MCTKQSSTHNISYPVSLLILSEINIDSKCDVTVYIAVQGFIERGMLKDSTQKYKLERDYVFL